MLLAKLRDQNVNFFGRKSSTKTFIFCFHAELIWVLNFKFGNIIVCISNSDDFGNSVGQNPSMFLNFQRLRPQSAEIMAVEPCGTWLERTHSRHLVRKKVPSVYSFQASSAFFRGVFQDKDISATYKEIFGKKKAKINKLSHFCSQ